MKTSISLLCLICLFSTHASAQKKGSDGFLPEILNQQQRQMDLDSQKHAEQRESEEREGINNDRPEVRGAEEEIFQLSDQSIWKQPLDVNYKSNELVGTLIVSKKEYLINKRISSSALYIVTGDKSARRIPAQVSETLARVGGQGTINTISPNISISLNADNNILITDSESIYQSNKGIRDFDHTSKFIIVDKSGLKIIQAAIKSGSKVIIKEYTKCKFNFECQ